MSKYAYVAIDPQGFETRGTLPGSDQAEVVRRVREMGLFPTKVLQEQDTPSRRASPRKNLNRKRAFPVLRPVRRIASARLSAFTRQLGTLLQAGMPLLRSLRILEQQEENQRVKCLLGQLSLSIEGGSSFAEAIAQHPRAFHRLYVSIVRAGELGGALDTSLNRLADFMERAQRLRGRIRAALFYPAAVLVIAGAILGMLMTFVVPRFKEVFDGLLNGQPLPLFTRFVFNLSETMVHHLPLVMLALGALVLVFALLLHTQAGRRAFDHFKLVAPILGPVLRKTAIARFARTLGTLLGTGVPILQALTVVHDAVGNVILGEVILQVHENVKEGEPLAPTLKVSGVFPAMVAGMIDVGEQTGALPEMLLKLADTYDAEVDNAAAAMTSLLEPVMLVFLAVVVGSIVFAVFLPLLYVVQYGVDTPAPRGE